MIRGPKRTLVALLTVLTMAACANSRPVPQFPAEGRSWPESPREARVAFVGEFTSLRDLGIRPSLWQRVVRFAAGAPDQNMVRPMAVAATADGQVIFVADPDANCVHRYDLEQRRYTCLSPESGMGFSPVGLAVTDDAWLIVSDSQQGLVYRGGLQDKTLQVFPLSEKLLQPTGVFWDAPTQRLLVTDTGQQQVFAFDRAGDLQSRIGGRGNGPGQFNFPTYIWVDANGQLLVTDTLNFRIQLFDSDGQFLDSFGENGDQPGDFARPKGVATDAFRHIYVIDALMHTMQIFNSEGTLLIAVGRQGQGEGEFWLPNGIFVAADNTIYVADTYNKRVQIFRYVGTES